MCAASGHRLYLRDVTEAHDIDRMKSEFLSAAAHELRTPLASIFGFTELMLVRQLHPDKQQELLGTIHRQSRSLIDLINELLDLSRIEARRGKDLRIASCSVAALVDGNPCRLALQGGSACPGVRASAWLLRGAGRP